MNFEKITPSGQQFTTVENLSSTLHLWQDLISSPTDFESHQYIFIVSGFRSEALFNNPQSLVDPYYGHLFTSVVGKNESLTPNRSGNQWRLGTFRPWGVILTVKEPRAIVELSDHDPGPLNVELATLSLKAAGVSPLELLNSTTVQNELKLKLDAKKQTVEIGGFFSFSDELESEEAKKLQIQAREMGVPFIVFDKKTGEAKKIYG